MNYQGGFTKRGLLGAVAYSTKDIVPPSRLLTYLLGIAYAVTSALLLFRFRMLERLSGVLLLVSPLGWLFPLLVPAAYGRKDVFVVMAVTICAGLITRFRRPAAMLAVSALVFGIAGLIVEIAWLYLPIVLAAWLFRHRGASRTERLTVLSGGLAYAGACLALTLRIGHVDTAAISASWAPIIVPDNGGSALCCINFSVQTAMATARAALPNAGDYATSEAFGLVPLVLLLSERRSHLRGRLSWLCLCIGAILALVPLATAADWGRYLYLWTTCTFVCAWVATQADDVRAEVPWWRIEPIQKLMFVAVYATTWQTVHYQFPDHAAFIPGIASRAIGDSSIAPFTQ